MLGRIRRDAEKITINGSGIQGVQSISAQYESVARPLTNLGITEMQYAPQGAQTANLQVNTLFTHTLYPSAPSTSFNVMQNFTGDSAFSGVVDYGSKKFIFTEGYMETFSCSCGVGEIPQINTSSIIYGEFGTGSLANLPTDHYPSSLNIPSYSSMEVNLDEFTSNRMTSFSVDIATPRIPIYALDNDKPERVMAGTPVEVNVNFSLDVDDYEIESMRFVPDITTFRNTTLTLKKNNSNTTLLTYSFDNMLLTSESFQGSAESNAAVNFNLRSFILR